MRFYKRNPHQIAINASLIHRLFIWKHPSSIALNIEYWIFQLHRNALRIYSTHSEIILLSRHRIIIKRKRLTMCERRNKAIPAQKCFVGLFFVFHSVDRNFPVDNFEKGSENLFATSHIKMRFRLLCWAPCDVVFSPNWGANALIKTHNM